MHHCDHMHRNVVKEKKKTWRSKVVRKLPYERTFVVWTIMSFHCLNFYFRETLLKSCMQMFGHPLPNDILFNDSWSEMKQTQQQQQTLF